MGEQPAQRVVLEESRALLSSDWAIVAKCIQGGLYVGRCDYGDGDETTEGFDITPVDALLSWLVRDRFGEDTEGLTAYAKERGFTPTAWEEITDSKDMPEGLSVVAMSDEGDAQIAQIGSGAPQACWLSTGCLLALSLLERHFYKETRKDLDYEQYTLF